jgi:hypothetical protein
MRSMSWLLLLSLATGCTWFGPGYAYTDSDAPFKIGSLKSARFIVDPQANKRGGEAVLFLSDGDVSCDDLSVWGEAESDDLDGFFEGSGLIFLLEADVWGRDAEFDPEDDWDGIWVQGYSADLGRLERQMGWFGFHEGSIVSSGGGYYGGGDPGWVSLETKGEKMKGDFQTVWWHGPFVAENCGEWDGRESGDDSGYVHRWDSGDW